MYTINDELKLENEIIKLHEDYLFEYLTRDNEDETTSSRLYSRFSCT